MYSIHPSSTSKPLRLEQLRAGRYTGVTLATRGTRFNFFQRLTYQLERLHPTYGIVLFALTVLSSTIAFRTFLLKCIEFQLI
jgi:hypothetical protein